MECNTIATILDFLRIVVPPIIIVIIIPITWVMINRYREIANGLLEKYEKVLRSIECGNCENNLFECNCEESIWREA